MKICSLKRQQTPPFLLLKSNSYQPRQLRFLLEELILDLGARFHVADDVIQPRVERLQRRHVVALVVQGASDAAL